MITTIYAQVRTYNLIFEKENGKHQAVATFWITLLITRSVKYMYYISSVHCGQKGTSISMMLCPSPSQSCGVIGI